MKRKKRKKWKERKGRNEKKEKEKNEKKGKEGFPIKDRKEVKRKRSEENRVILDQWKKWTLCDIVNKKLTTRITNLPLV